RAGAQPAEEARPDALQEVERVEPRPQELGELAAHDEADLGLVAGEQLMGGQFVPVADAVEERPEFASPGWVAVVVRIRAARRIARGHRGLLPRVAALGFLDRAAIRTVSPGASYRPVPEGDSGDQTPRRPSPVHHEGPLLFAGPIGPARCGSG